MWHCENLKHCLQPQISLHDTCTRYLPQCSQVLTLKFFPDWTTRLVLRTSSVSVRFTFVKRWLSVLFAQYLNILLVYFEFRLCFQLLCSFTRFAFLTRSSGQMPHQTLRQTRRVAYCRTGYLTKSIRSDYYSKPKWVNIVLKVSTFISSFSLLFSSLKIN